MARKKRKQRLLLTTNRQLQSSAVQLMQQKQLMIMMTVLLIISIFTLTSAVTSSIENATATPNYLETGRQITGILNRFMSLGYDKRVRPNYGGPPVEVNVTMRILSISSVSEVMMDFTADFYFRQTWHDPRLSFKKLGDIQTLYVGAEVSKKIWLPDTFFGNEKLAYFHEATTPNVFLRIDHSGEVYRSIRLTVTSSCPMNLQYFPMDRQRCTIEAESYGYNVKDIIYRWARETAVERDKEISLPQFDIVTTEQKYRLEELSSGTYSRLIAEILFARRMGYYLIQIYIPSSLIVVISWVSFWLHRNASPARVQLGVTTVLTMTTLMSSTNAALPKISYVKSIDIFLGTCFVMVFAALLEYATVGYLGKRIAMRKAHVQHAQSQAQARVFAQLQAQGAQGDPVPPIASSLLEPSSATSLLLQSPNLQITPDICAAGSLQTTSGSSPALQLQQHQQVSFLQQFVEAQTATTTNQPPQVPERATHRHCHCHSHHHNSNSSSRNHYQVAAVTNNNNNNNNTLLRSCCYAQPTTTDSFQTAPAHRQCRHQCKYQSNLTCHTLPLNSANSGHQLVDKSSCALQVNQHLSSSQPHLCACLEDSHQHQHQHRHHHHQHQYPHQHQQQQQEAGHTGESFTCHLSSPNYSNNNLKSGPSAAATAAAATFINLHRKKQGLPPSTNPVFAQYAWKGQNCGVETIFGVRPSDIDKYSRVVFPVCFVCFQLMYWIVYLHISAFLEHEHQKPVN